MDVNLIQKYSKELELRTHESHVIDYLSDLGKFQKCNPDIVMDVHRFAGCEAPIYITMVKSVPQELTFEVSSSNLSTLGIAYMMFDILSTCSSEQARSLSFQDFSLITMYFSVIKKRDLQVILNATQHLIGKNI